MRMEHRVVLGVARRFAACARGAAFTWSGTPGVEEERALSAACRRPELRPLLQGRHLAVGHALGVPLRAPDGDTVELDRTSLATPGLAAFHLRHGLELAAWQRAAPAPRAKALRFVFAVLGLHTAFAYLATLGAQEVAQIEAHLPEWMRALHARLRTLQQAGAAPEEIVRLLAEHQRRLLPLQGVERWALENGELRRMQALAVKGLALALPSERILTQDGDNRLLISGETGLNKYGCSPRPRPWAITFSTCTASSISDPAYEEAERQRQALFGAVLEGRFAPRFAEEMEHVRAELAGLLGLETLPGTGIILTPSGTDAELYVVYFLLAASGRPVLNILTAAQEVGSGSASAAAGRHFDSHTPRGKASQRGAALEGLRAERIRVQELAVRAADGALLPSAAIDARLEALTAAAVQAGEAVLIHLLDSSKTGLGAPSRETVARLKETYGDAVAVIVDAAQMRLSRAALRDYLASGFLVIVTGSKFFTGPPFSGALIVPPAFARKVGRLAPLPAGFADYATRSDCPACWGNLVTRLSDAINLGLLLRWRAALWEMQAFYSVPEADQYAIFDDFRRRLVERIAANPDVELVETPVYDRGYAAAGTSWDQVPTIFTFLVKRRAGPAGEARLLSYEEAVRAYHWLNMDISAALPAQCPTHERRIAAQACHIGQPVRITRNGSGWAAALRIAAGARLVSRVCYDPSLGREPAERLTWQVEAATRVLEKLSLICRHWEAIAAARSADEGAG